MEISNRREYYNSIYSAVVVNSNSDLDPEGKGRVQIYLPSVQIEDEYQTMAIEYMTTNDKQHHAGWDIFPWATTLVEGLEEGNAVYGSNIDNENHNYIILGLDVNNPANNRHNGIDLGAGSLYGILDLAMPIIIHNEVGIATKDWPNDIPHEKYISINPQDNGGWSIGLIQWHHCRAFDCLYEIAKVDTGWKNKFTNQGLDLCTDIQKSLDNNSTMGYRTKYQSNYQPQEGTDSYNSIQNMLGSDIGKEVQKAYASQDTASSLDILMGEPNNITNPAILIYLADIMNQYGQGLPQTIKKAASISGGSGDIMSQLNEFVSWCKENLGSFNTYINRRNTTYSYIEQLYNEGRLNLGIMVDLTSMIASNYIPEAGEYIWPVPVSDQINCFWGDTAEQSIYINGSEQGKYHWGGLWHNSPHSGIDIAPQVNGVAGDECIAIGDGTVTGVEKGSPGTAGYYVCIELDKKVNPDYPYVVYMHFCRPSDLNVGDRVVAGKTVIRLYGYNW